MESTWGPFGLWLRIHIAMIALWGVRQCWSLNDEGLALLEFRQRITSDPYGALTNWNPNDSNPCKWSGIHCADGKVQMLDLNGLSLGGTLGPELGKLSHLKSLVLCNNNFSGTIPKELGDLNKLELLDLTENNLTGSIPAGFRNRKFAHYVRNRGFKQQNKAGSSVIQIKGTFRKCLAAWALPLFKPGRAFPHGCEEKRFDSLPGFDEPATDPSVSDLVNSARRKLLDQPTNLAAAPFVGEPAVQLSSVPITLSSGAFPAVPAANREPNEPPPSPTPPSESPQDTSNQENKTNNNAWKTVLIILAVIILVSLILILLWIWRKRATKAIQPWKTGISGQLQKAFVTGVPNLNRAELETACEDFSNIIFSFEECTTYKGTLSSGVEIAVASTTVTSSEDWSKNMEMAYRKKIDTLSRINHKNFTNLIGYCEEEEPFTRMMVFEYAPSGSLFEHLHVPEVEHLDWSARMRIVMGTAYCLQYMHHDLNPPITHTKLDSASILLTDDFAAKVSEIAFGKRVTPTKTTGDESKKSELPPDSNPETDVYNFGILLLEIISGKLPYTEEQGHLVKWAAEYLNDKKKISYIIDPTLQSFKDDELGVVCDVIHECIRSDPRQRPTMKDITCKLREVIRITPEQAVPRLSPLWWAELEILSVEAS